MRTNIDGIVEDGKFLGSYHILYTLKNHPKISIFIPNRDRPEDLSLCIKSLISNSTYRNFEVIIIENGSKEDKTFQLYEELKKTGTSRILVWDESFNFSAVNNFAAKYATGDVFLFLNNDVEIIRPDWLENLLQHVMRREIGAVGAKLYYPNDRIQHAGIIIGLGGVAGHPHRYCHAESNGYMGRLLVVQNVAAVTGACLMIRRGVYEEVGGFDENFALSYNDVDLCMRIRENGYLIVITPYAELYHHESATRGYEDMPEKKSRFEREASLFKTKWASALEKGDPYYNPNLSLIKDDFSQRT